MQSLHVNLALFDLFNTFKQFKLTCTLIKIGVGGGGGGSNVTNNCHPEKYSVKAYHLSIRIYVHVLIPCRESVLQECDNTESVNRSVRHVHVHVKLALDSCNLNSHQPFFFAHT